MKAFFVSLCFFMTISAQAFVQTTSRTGVPIFWPQPASPVFTTNWINSSGLSYNDVFNIFTTSLGRWKQTGAAVGFDYWQGSNSGAPRVMGYDGKNAIFFASNSTQKLGNSTLAVTSTMFYSTGEIVEADVEFNDEAVIFTTNPSDSTVFGDHNHTYLGSVATHELGHAYGLSHSANLQSTMVYTEYRGQTKPSCDDLSGVHTMYPESGFTAARGSISGSVKVGAAAIFGAHVQAISKGRGTVVAAAISSPDGSYTIRNLEPGDYYLLVEPFQGASPIASLCGGSASDCYHGGVNSHTICTGQPFKRGLVEQKTTVTAGATTALGIYNASCSAMTGGTVSSSVAAAHVAGAILNGNGSVSKAMVMGNVGSDQYFRIDNASGTIVVKALSYSLYSPFDPVVTIVDGSGNTVSGVVAVDNGFTNSSQYTNYDSAAALLAAPNGTYYVKVSNKGVLAADQFPASLSIDALKFFLLIVSTNDNETIATDILAANARCEFSDSFGAFPDHGPPPAAPAPSTPGLTAPSTPEKSSGGACGTIKRVGGDHRFKPPGISAIFSVWGMTLMLILARILGSVIIKRHEKV